MVTPWGLSNAARRFFLSVLEKSARQTTDQNINAHKTHLFIPKTSFSIN